MRRIAKYLIAASVIVITLTSVIVYASTRTPAVEVKQAVVTGVDDKTALPPTPQELFELTNAERVKAGVKPLLHDALLDKSASLKSEDENTNKYFGHVSPNTGKHGYEYIAGLGKVCIHSGENITQNTLVNDSIHAIQAWMNSEPHRKALLDPVTDEVGFGVSGNYITAHFCDNQ